MPTLRLHSCGLNSSSRFPIVNPCSGEEVLPSAPFAPRTSALMAPPLTSRTRGSIAASAAWEQHRTRQQRSVTRRVADSEEDSDSSSESSDGMDDSAEDSTVYNTAHGDDGRMSQEGLEDRFTTAHGDDGRISHEGLRAEDRFTTNLTANHAWDYPLSRPEKKERLVLLDQSLLLLEIDHLMKRTGVPAANVLTLLDQTLLLLEINQLSKRSGAPAKPSQCIDM